MIDNGKIEKKAEGLLAKMGYEAIPVPIKKIIKGLGIVIKPDYLGDEISGLLITEKGRTIIGYNSIESTVRQRFTLAHELGHHILHNEDKLFVDKIMYRKSFSSEKERAQEIEANAFAAAILMPHKILSDEFNLLMESPEQLTEENIVGKLSSRFKVSSIAMTYRLINLKLLTKYSI